MRSLRLVLCARLVVLVVLALGLSPSAMAVTVKAYSSVSINSFTSVTDAGGSDDDFLVDTTGATVTLSATSPGFVNAAYPNPNPPGYTVKPVSDDVYAQASLATGTLKTKAELAYGTDVTGAIMPVNTRNGSSNATATIADSFSTVNSSDHSPFNWSSGDKGTFHFSITGSATVPAGLADPSSSKNQIFSDVTLSIFKAGTLDLIQQRDSLDFSSNPTLWNALNDQINANFISFDYLYLGDPLVAFAVDPAHVVALNPSGATNVDLTFDPGQGDFDWILSLSTFDFVDASEQNVDIVQDFSHTVETSYDGPPGTTTFGAVEFPGDLQEPSSVPEPATTALFVMGLGGVLMGVARRRR